MQAMFQVGCLLTSTIDLLILQKGHIKLLPKTVSAVKHSDHDCMDDVTVRIINE